MQSPDSLRSRLSVSVRCLGLILAVFELGTKSIADNNYSLLCSTYNEIGSQNLVSMPFPSADRGPHAPSTQIVAVVHRLIYLQRSKSETSGNVNCTLLPYLSHCVRIFRQNFSDFDGMGVVFPLCVF